MKKVFNIDIGGKPVDLNIYIMYIYLSIRIELYSAFTVWMILISEMHNGFLPSYQITQKSKLFPSSQYSNQMFKTFQKFLLDSTKHLYSKHYDRLHLTSGYTGEYSFGVQPAFRAASSSLWMPSSQFTQGLLEAVSSPGDSSSGRKQESHWASAGVTLF